MCRTCQCSPPATTMWFQSSILWRSLDEFRKCSPTNGSRFFLIWTHWWLNKCLQGCSWNGVRSNHWWFQTEEAKVERCCNYRTFAIGMECTCANFWHWILQIGYFSSRSFLLKWGSIFRFCLSRSGKTEAPRSAHVVINVAGPYMLAEGEVNPGTITPNLGRGLTHHEFVTEKNQKSGCWNWWKRITNLWQNTFSSSAKRWVSCPQFFVFGWGASGCLHLVQGTLCGCQYGGWKLKKGWCESIFQGLQHSSK